jgi:P27 family predicted phage terminase small subunit
LSAPKHLSKGSKDFYNKITKQYELEDHHLKILKLACESLDTIEKCRESISKTGLIYLDRYGKPKVNPAAKLEAENKILFARLIRELSLDIESPGAIGRPPGLY